LAELGFGGSHSVGVRGAGRQEGVTTLRVIMMIKGDRQPGHLPSEDFLAQMGKYNEELSKAGVLLDLSALHWSAEGVRVKFSGGKHRHRRALRRAKGDRRRLLDPPG
jgi:hypothetical protein